MYSEKFKPSALGPFFSGTDLGYHALAMPLYILITNWVCLGSSYFSETWLLLSCSVLSLILYSDTVLLLNFLFRRISALYPAVQQSSKRTWRILLSAGLVSALSTALVLSLVSMLEVPGNFFPLQKIGAAFSVSLLFNTAFCLVAGTTYVQQKGLEEEQEKEALKETNRQLRHQLQTRQADSHFIFNSLHCLNGLIAQDAHRAERYVQELSRVYRYFIEAKKPELTTLETELGFVRAYYQLLQTRFGQAISLDIELTPEYLNMQLPPLSLQLLLENAVKHNLVRHNSPLCIEIKPAGNSSILVRNNLQRKSSTEGAFQIGLSGIAARYKLFEDCELTIEESPTHFTITVPLIHNSEYKEVPVPVEVNS